MKPGPAHKPIFIGPVRPLTLDDIARLSDGKRTGRTVQKLRASHHDIARLAANGFTHREIAAHTGYTPLRVNQLLGSPAMEELVAVYRQRIEERQQEQFDAYLTLKTQNMIAAERHISDHIAELDETGELLPVKTALAISADGADRTGYGKRQQVTVNHDFAAALEKAIARSGKVIDITPAPRRQSPLPTQHSSPELVGVVAEGQPLIRRRA